MNENNDETEQFGIHLMLDGYGANPTLLKDKEALISMLKSIPVSLGMHIISDPVVVEVGPKNRKDPGGLSGFVLIAESHLSFHTFPNRKFVTVDLYTCQNDMDSEKIVKELRKAFEISSSEIHIQKRGTAYPSNDLV